MFPFDKFSTLFFRVINWKSRSYRETRDIEIVRDVIPFINGGESFIRMDKLLKFFWYALIELGGWLKSLSKVTVNLITGNHNSAGK